MACKMVGYYRISNGKSGGADSLGIDAQKATVAAYVAAHGCTLIASYTEVETARKDGLANRPELRKAIAHAKSAKATLVIAKLDRLSRNVHFLSGLMEEKVTFVACDLPDANDLTVHIMAAVAQQEAQRISQRTKEALAAKKRRGEKLGNPAHLSAEAAARGRALGAQRAREKAIEEYADVIGPMQSMQEQGLSLNAIARTLNAEGRTTRFDRPWNAMQVNRVLQRAVAWMVANDMEQQHWHDTPPEKRRTDHPRRQRYPAEPLPTKAQVRAKDHDPGA
jgi:DNA invertase Pin-like site-specific DNA recombinase